MANYMKHEGGYLLPESDGGPCLYCPMNDTMQYLDRIDVSFDERWRNFGLLWVFVVFNVAMAMALYWVFRVPKNKKIETTAEKKEN